MNETATLDRNMNDIYEIKLQCNDGTDTTENILTLELTKDIDDPEGPPDWVEAETYALGTVAVISVVVDVGVVYVIQMNALIPVF